MSLFQREVMDLPSGRHEQFELVGHNWGAIASYVACALAPTRVVAAVTLSIPQPWTFRAPKQLVAERTLAWFARHDHARVTPGTNPSTKVS